VRSFNRLFLVLTLLLTVSLPACREGQKKTAAGFDKIPREQLIRLMADVELTEAALKLKQVKMSRDSVKLIAEKCYDSLYHFYGVTPELFRENLRYYQLDMEEFQAITDSVIINLTRRKDSVSNLSKTLDTLKTKTPDTVKTKTPDAVKTKTPVVMKLKSPIVVKPKIR